MNKIKKLFGDKQPIIAMAHVPALPSAARYNKEAGLEGMVEQMRADIDCLVKGGVDAIMFCNEDDRPYSLNASMEQVAAMTRVVTELRPTSLPFGVDFLWDAKAAVCIAAATGASFVREVFTGVYESDMGLWSPDAAEVFKLSQNIGASELCMLFNVAPEFCSPLGNRSITQRVRSAVVSSLADAILISGEMAGSEPDLEVIRQAKQAAGENVPVFVNTGTKPGNVKAFLSIADGVIVGSSLKVDGYTWNPVDPQRVEAYVRAARA
jgi:uncharacterized protein